MRLSSRWGPCWSRYICHGRWSTARGFGRLLLWCREWILPRQPRSVPVLASKNYVVQLWPSITMLAFQIFSSSFTGHGRCLDSDKGTPLNSTYNLLRGLLPHRQPHQYRQEDSLWGRNTQGILHLEWNKTKTGAWPSRTWAGISFRGAHILENSILWREVPEMLLHQHKA